MNETKVKSAMGDGMLRVTGEVGDWRGCYFLRRCTIY